MPPYASVHPVEPVFNTSTSPLVEVSVVGGRETFCMPQQAERGATKRRTARMIAHLYNKHLQNMPVNPDYIFLVTPYGSSL
jgi:hypothetical protein